MGPRVAVGVVPRVVRKVGVSGCSQGGGKSCGVGLWWRVRVEGSPAPGEGFAGFAAGIGLCNLDGLWGLMVRRRGASGFARPGACPTRAASGFTRPGADPTRAAWGFARSGAFPTRAAWGFARSGAFPTRATSGFTRPGAFPTRAAWGFARSGALPTRAA